MPLIMNGTTIPQNVANALSFNGTNITQVVFNGTVVWSQSLFSGIWSNTTAYSILPSRNSGSFQTSSVSGFRRYSDVAGSTSPSGSALFSSWVTCGQSGFSLIGLTDGSSTKGDNLKYYFSGWTIRLATTDINGNPSFGSGICTYDPSTKNWSGSSQLQTGGYTLSFLETSGGLLRSRNQDTVSLVNQYGSWVSLT
jgi:hypothetical protein